MYEVVYCRAEVSLSAEGSCRAQSSLISESLMVGAIPTSLSRPVKKSCGT